MSQLNGHLRKASAISLVLLWLISSCVNQNVQSPGEGQVDPPGSASVTLPEGTSDPTTGTPYPIERTPHPIATGTGLQTPDHSPAAPTVTRSAEYPWFPTFTPFTPQPRCEEDNDNVSNTRAAPTDTPAAWYFRDITTLTNAEVGNAAPEQIVKLFFEKYFDQFKTPQADQWQLEDYEIYSLSITNTIQCKGPIQLENTWGHVEYSVKPPVDARDIFWESGGSHPVVAGWIGNGIDFVLIKTKSGYELKLMGNG